MSKEPDPPSELLKCRNCTAIVLWDTKEDGEICFFCEKPIRSKSGAADGAAVSPSAH
ncbi:hypothetical protein [Streptomyces sp. NPDC003006]